MAKVHEIGIGADTRAFEDQIKRGVIDPTEKAEKALKELGDTDAGADAARDLDKLEDELKDVQKQSEKAERAVDDIGGTGGKSFGKMSEGAQEVTQEIGSNLGEAVSSIRGDLSDLGQVGQDTLGGLAATLASGGPAGIAGAAALAAGAVGLGLVTAEIEKQNERTQALKQYFADAWQEAVDGGKAYIESATVIGEMQDLMFNPDRADEYKQIQQDANDLSLDRSTLLRAAAGDEEALQSVQSRSNAILQDSIDKVDEFGEIRSKGASPERARASQEQADAQAVNDRWTERGEIYDENKSKAEEARQIESDYLKSLVAGAGEASEEIDELGNKLYTLPTGEQILIEADTGRATDNIDAFKGDLDGVPETINTSASFNASAAQAEVNRFISQNDGRTIKINGRYVGPSGTEWE